MIETILLSAILIFFGFVVYKMTKKSKVKETPSFGGGGGELPIEDPDLPTKPVEMEKSES
jgi:hypothetical protein